MEVERLENKYLSIVAKIIVKGETVCFDPFASDVDEHFSDVTREVFDKIWKEEYGLSYQEYKKDVTSSSKIEVPIQRIDKMKKKLLSDINKQFKERGISTLKNFSGESNGMDFVIGWESIRESVKEEYEVPDKPTEKIRDIPPKPSPDDPEFQPELGVLDYVVPSRKKSKEEEVSKKFKKRRKKWKRKAKEIKSINEREIEKWNQERYKYENIRAEIIEKINITKEKYERGDRITVENVVDAKIRKTDYPRYISFREIKEIFNNDIDTRYVPDNKKLLIKYVLPKIQDIPQREKIEYLEEIEKFKSVDVTESSRKETYRDVPFNIAVRIIRQVLNFDFSSGKVIDSIVFNGFASHVDEETGIEEAICKVSVECSREEVREMDLSEANPQAAFEHLGGRSAPSMCDASSVTPIMQMRAVDSEPAAAGGRGEDSEGVNDLAEMDWEEFEHLIVELFEGEFADEGGELTVTQASRGGGIDAIAYDPDPLRGGKFVIQARRSTQTVRASAVQDLQETVTSENADKGVLVTTSDFSPSAHDFAKDKLIQLLNGDDLLRLLDRHGYDAQIDMDQARSENEQ